MSWHDRWTITRAQKLGGKVTEDNRKMPGTTFALDARQCRLGQVLHKIPGTTCAECNMIGLQHHRSKVQKGYAQNQLATVSTLARHGPKVYGEAHAYQILEFGYLLHRWLSSGDLPNSLMLDGICHAGRLTPHVTHWVTTRELPMVLDWWRGGGRTLKPSNVILRVSQAKIDRPPINNLPDGVLTSTTHKKIEDRDAYGFACPSLKQDHTCGNCRACWDASVPNISYRMQAYGRARARKGA